MGIEEFTAPRRASKEVGGKLARRLSGLAMALVFGCQGSDPLRASVMSPNYPTREEIAELTAVPIVPSLTVPGKQVVEWNLVGPLPRWTDAGMPTRSRSEAVTRRFVTRNGNFRANMSLVCVAREVGHFHTVHSELPSRSLLDFMVRRCGWTGPQVVPAIFPKLPAVSQSSFIDGLLQRTLSDHDYVGEIGISLKSDPQGDQLVAVVGKREVMITSLPMVPAGDYIQVQGTGIGGQPMWAYITSGEHDVRECEREVSSPPEFSMRCPVQRTDPSAIIELTASEAGHKGDDTLARVWLSPDGTLPATFRRRSERIEHSPMTSVDLEILGLLNTVRASLGRPPLQLSRADSDMLHRIHAHYLYAHRLDQEASLTTLRRGALAGWGLPTQIIAGGFGQFDIDEFSRSHDALEDALNSPSIRVQLLGRDRDYVAMSVLGGEGWNPNVMFVTWESAPSHDELLERERSFMARLSQRRSTRRLPSAVALGDAYHEALRHIGQSFSTTGVGRTKFQAFAEAELSETRLDNSADPQREVHFMYVSEERAVSMDIRRLFRNGHLSVTAHAHLHAWPGQKWATVIWMIAYFYGDPVDSGLQIPSSDRYPFDEAPTLETGTRAW